MYNSIPTEQELPFLLCYFFPPLHHMACRILASQPGIEPRLQVLTTELQGDSHVWV